MARTTTRQRVCRPVNDVNQRNEAMLSNARVSEAKKIVTFRSHFRNVDCERVSE